MHKHISALATCVVAAFLVLAASAAMSHAQGAVATPNAQGTPIASPAYPAHIHAGTCANLGDVLFPLNDITPLGIDVAPLGGTPTSGEASPDAEIIGTPVAVEAPGVNPVVAESTTDVETSLDDLLAAEHAINVHQSPGAIQIYIACGDITGSPENGELTIELLELNNSGYIGEAHLMDNGDGTTTVTVTLMYSALSLPGTPAATPAT